MKPVSSLHIVRRYGPVGGMEKYIWELTHALYELGHPVTVVCEQCMGKVKNDIHVIETGSIKSHPRWLSMLRFSRRVSKLIKPLKQNPTIIHSHERTAVHDVTTIHGPSILNRKKSRADTLSPRLMTWEFLEKREVAAPNVKCVIPNSLPISNQLKNAYPQVAHLIQQPMYPGVDPNLSKLKSQSAGKTVGFIGFEWKRKGLAFACEIISQLQALDPEIRFVVAGCPKNEVSHLFVNWKSDFEILGWIDPADFYTKIDVLIHPARNEPFGMVIAEANAAGVPVLISSQCGIAPMIGKHQGKVLELSNKDSWVNSCQGYLTNKPMILPLSLSWVELAKSHAALYLKILENKLSNTAIN